MLYNWLIRLLSFGANGFTIRTVLRYHRTDQRLLDAFEVGKRCGMTDAARLHRRRSLEGGLGGRAMLESGAEGPNALPRSCAFSASSRSINL
jgi:hypothetical protein